MISVPQLCRNRLEDVNNLSNTILLPIEVQMYEFHRKSENSTKKALNQRKQKNQKRVKNFTERFMHAALAHSEPSLKHLTLSLLQWVSTSASSYEMDYFIYFNKKLFLSYQELDTCKIETSENSRQKSKQ